MLLFFQLIPDPITEPKLLSSEGTVMTTELSALTLLLITTTALYSVVSWQLIIEWINMPIAALSIEAFIYL